MKENGREKLRENGNYKDNIYAKERHIRSNTALLQEVENIIFGWEELKAGNTADWG
jgi:hypothetical protein